MNYDELYLLLTYQLYMDKYLHAYVDCICELDVHLCKQSSCISDLMWIRFFYPEKMYIYLVLWNLWWDVTLYVTPAHTRGTAFDCDQHLVVGFEVMGGANQSRHKLMWHLLILSSRDLSLALWNSYKGLKTETESQLFNFVMTYLWMNFYFFSYCIQLFICDN